MSGSCSARVCASAASRSNTHTWELALGAAQNALADAGITAEELDLILVSTCSPDTNTPNTASILQDKLGARQVGAFDINNACTGFVSATDIADSYIKSGKAAHRAGRFGGDAFAHRRLHRPLDVHSVRRRRGCGRLSARPRTNRSAFCPPSLRRTARVQSTCTWKPCRSRIRFAVDRTVDPKARFLKMQGARGRALHARAVPLAIDTALKRAGITAEDIDWVVPHQANLRILEVIARRYHVPKEKIYVNMDRFGNTSSASVPICLNEMRQNGLLHEGQTIVCTGFGGGLT